MAIMEQTISEAKRASLQKAIKAMAETGANWRQIARMALHKYNVKIKR